MLLCHYDYYVIIMLCIVTFAPGPGAERTQHGSLLCFFLFFFLSCLFLNCLFALDSLSRACLGKRSFTSHYDDIITSSHTLWWQQWWCQWPEWECYCVIMLCVLSLCHYYVVMSLLCCYVIIMLLCHNYVVMYIIVLLCYVQATGATKSLALSCHLLWCGKTTSFLAPFCCAFKRSCCQDRLRTNIS